MKVRANAFYTYQPVGMDRFNPPVGAEKGILKAGDRVQVVNLGGCPRANTMGMCHIQTMKGEFAGLVMTNSLVK